MLIIAILPLFLFILGGCAASQKPATLPPGYAAPVKPSSLKFLQPWDAGRNLIQCAVEEIDSSGYRIKYLTFYNDSISTASELYRHRDLYYPMTIMPLRGNSRNLLTVWETNGVNYIVRIYALVNGKVQEVLNETTSAMPEFFYETKGLEELSILIANMDLVNNKKTKTRDVQPVSANLYRWKDNKYIKVANVPWTKRFNPGK